MKALMYYGWGGNGRGDFRLEDVAEPTVMPGTVKIDVKWCGICGSDLHEFEADTGSGYSPPVILGHEFAGTVSAVGEGSGGDEHLYMRAAILGQHLEAP